MSLSRQSVLQTLEKLSIIASSEVEPLLQPADPSQFDGDQLLDELIKRNVVTRYQAKAIRSGKSASLLLRDYLVQDIVGRGGMGVVFRALHLRLKRLVALKVLPADVVKDGNARKRFEQEVQMLARLNHPNIVQCYDASEDHGLQFLVTEYIDGVDVARFQKQRGKLSIRRAADITCRTAEALQHAHAQNIIHRDIKPSNLLISREGTIKLLDLGIAGFVANLRQESQSADLTKTGTMMGTADFLPPEQALNSKSADQRSDLYALGCTLFFLLTGEPPYRRETVMQTIFAHQGDPTPRVRSLRKDVPQQLDDLCYRMMEKEPEKRPQSVAEVIPILARLSGDLRADSAMSGDALAVPRGASAGMAEHPSDAVVPIAVEEVREAASGGTTDAVPDFVDEAARPYSRRWVTIGLGVAATGAVIAGGVSQFLPEPPPKPAQRVPTRELLIRVHPPDAEATVTVNKQNVPFEKLNQAITMPLGEYVVTVAAANHRTEKVAVTLDQGEQPFIVNVQLTPRDQPLAPAGKPRPTQSLDNLVIE